jgi:hypothetical protein
MEFNNRKYATVSASTLAYIQPSQIVGNFDTLRWNVAGTKAVVEFAPGSAYYNLSFGKTHAEILEVMNTPEWTPADE